MIWTEVVIRTNEAVASEISELIRPFGQNSSVVVEQLGDPENLDPNALLPEVYLKIYVSEIVDSPMLRDSLTQIALDQGLEKPEFRRLEESEWADAWKIYYKPFRIGRRFWIYPQWEPLENDLEDSHVIRIDPGLAFGTGQHETTQLCLEILEDVVNPGTAVLDLGTGSGILSIGAAHLGAERVTAVDNDPVAVRSAGENAHMNGVGERIEFLHGSVEAARGHRYDVLLVNILAAIIMPMIEHDGLLDLANSESTLVFSGIVEQQRLEFLNFLDQAGVMVKEIRKKNDWLAIIAQLKK